MSERKVKFVPDESYHIYNRGNSKREIFHDGQDKERFLKMLYICNGSKRFKVKDLLKVDKDIFMFDRGETLVNILCYVLMPNHFHIFLSVKNFDATRTDSNLESNVSVFMKRLTGAYTRYYNYKYNRTGSLFESKFKSEHIGSSNYFKYLFSYIHLNPIKIIQKNWREEGINNFKKTELFLREYMYSSFPEYFNTPRQVGGAEKIVNTKEFLNKIPSDTDLGKEIFDWLKFETIN